MSELRQATGFLTSSDGIRVAMRKAGPPSSSPVILVAGWPQTLHAWRYVQDQLADAGVGSIALDPPGLGESDVLSEIASYATPNVASVLADAIASACIKRYTLVGHDVGAWIAYAWAATRPEGLASVVLLDAAIPGAIPDGLFTLERAAGLFQFFFNAVPDLPEQLTQGRERIYLEWLFKAKTRVADAIRPEDIDVYMRCFGQPERMSAGFNYYRAVPASSAALAKAPPLTMPVLALGAEFGVGGGLAQAMQTRCKNLVGGIIAGSGHFIPEEAPIALTERLVSFLKECE
jgi:pimeloyl-ACP methyl ester carboxylesterase